MICHPEGQWEEALGSILPLMVLLVPLQLNHCQPPLWVGQGPDLHQPHLHQWCLPAAYLSAITSRPH